MDYPLNQKSFAARLVDSDFQLLNDLIPELFPDRDLSDKSLTGREIVIAIAETAAMKLSKKKDSRPEDLDTINQQTQRINDLEAAKLESDDTVKTLSDSLKKANDRLVEFGQSISYLETRNAELETELSGLSTEKTEVTEKVRTLEKYAPVPNEMRIIIEPLTLAVLILYAEKIQRRTGREVPIGEILTTLFTRYVTKRETELPGFPFLVSRQEISDLAKSLENV